MKRTIATILSTALALVMVLSLAACGEDAKLHSDLDSALAALGDLDGDFEGLSDSEIKNRVQMALAKYVEDHYSEASPYRTTFKISQRSKNGNYIDIYGTCTLYDKYGKVTTGYFDGSGSYTKSFEVNLSLEGLGDKCDIMN